MENKKHDDFSLNDLGDIKKWHGYLGERMPILVYRLMQCTMMSVISRAHGIEQTSEYFRQAGVLAGREFAKNILDLTVEFNRFIIDLQAILQDLKIGILCVEAFAPATNDIIFTIEQDSEYNKLPIIMNESVSIYDEGFIAGILEAYHQNQ